jgi:hypothetical protein
MAVQLQISGIKKLNGSSLSTVVDISNFNFNTLKSALTEFLETINYNQGTTVTIDVQGISADLIDIRKGLSVYGTQLSGGIYPEVINLDPSGAITAKNIYLEDVVESRRLRLKVFGVLPLTGIPGEIVYITSQSGKQEGFYGYLVSTGWTLLSGSGGSGLCPASITRSATPNNITGDAELVSNGLLPMPAPITSSEYLFFINGQQILVGDGTKTAPAYFSKDGGITASPYGQIDSTDELYWNTTVAGYGLDSGDIAVLIYSSIDPYCNQTGTYCTTNIIQVGETSTNLYQAGVEIILNGPATQTIPLTVCNVPTPPVLSPGGSLPTGYFIQNAVYSYNITAPIPLGALIGFTMPQSMTQAEFNTVRIFHEVSGVYIDETVLTGQYAPNYANRKIYAQVSSLSPFYAIPLDAIPTTTTTTIPPSTTTIEPTTTTTTCPPSSISYSVEDNIDATEVSFIGSPIGPHTIIFTQGSNVYNLSQIKGAPISLSWIFDITDPDFVSAGITSVFGEYSFYLASGCQYLVQVELPSLTTTTTAGPTTTTTLLETTTVSPEETTSTTLEPTTTSTTEESTTTSTTLYCDQFSVSAEIINETEVEFSVLGTSGVYYEILQNNELLWSGLTPEISQLDLVTGQVKVSISGGCDTCFDYNGDLLILTQAECQAPEPETTTTTTTIEEETTTTTIDVCSLFTIDMQVIYLNTIRFRIDSPESLLFSVEQYGSIIYDSESTDNLHTLEISGGTLKIAIDGGCEFCYSFEPSTQTISSDSCDNYIPYTTTTTTEEPTTTTTTEEETTTTTTEEPTTTTTTEEETTTTTTEEETTTTTTEEETTTTTTEEPTTTTTTEEETTTTTTLVEETTTTERPEETTTTEEPTTTTNLFG